VIVEKVKLIHREKTAGTGKIIRGPADAENR
jgi:hypothetical protein